MSMRDNKDGYAWPSVLLHWLGAISVLTLIVLGLLILTAGDRDAKRAAVALHVSVAMSVYAILLARIVWRGLNRDVPPTPDQHAALKLLAVWTPRLLLALIAAQLITGPLSMWTGGRAIEVFNWFAIPSPLAENHDLHELLEEVHEYTAFAIMGLVGLHILGALKHAVIDRDGVLQRMLAARSGP